MGELDVASQLPENEIVVFSWQALIENDQVGLLRTRTVDRGHAINREAGLKAVSLEPYAIAKTDVYVICNDQNLTHVFDSPRDRVPRGGDVATVCALMPVCSVLASHDAMDSMGSWCRTAAAA